MTFESEGLLFVAIYIWLPPASYVVFLTTLVTITIFNEITVSVEYVCRCYFQFIVYRGYFDALRDIAVIHYLQLFRTVTIYFTSVMNYNNEIILNIVDIYRC